jgi:dTDP-4-amino-4,6-dideoxygalactose transaminase
MNEMQALMGILVLKHLDSLIERSRQIDATYRECLKGVPGIKFPPPPPANVKYNFVYQPIEIEKDQFGMSRDDLYGALKKYNIFTRRYFYPLLCDFPCYRSIAIKDPLLTARRVTERILCLPIYPDLAIEDVVRICETVAFLQTRSKLGGALVYGR